MTGLRLPFFIASADRVPVQGNEQGSTVQALPGEFRGGYDASEHRRAYGRSDDERRRDRQAGAAQLHDEVGSLTQARDLSQQSYQAGAIALTDVLDADRQWLAARDDLAANRAEAARAAVRSFRAVGGGWTT